MNDPDPRDLGAFAAVARHRSYRRAAQELRVSVSSLSQRMSDLEARLGVRLLNRTTRSVAPTEAGATLLERVTGPLAELRAAVDALADRRGTPTGRLRINAPAPAIDLVLAPMVAPFLARHPGIQLEIVSDPLRIDIVAQGYDAGVRYEEHLAQDMIAVSLGPDERYAIVATPDVLAKHGVPKHPQDLVGKPSVGVAFPNGVMLPWEFEKGGRLLRIVPAGPFAATSVPTQLCAALDGVGFLGTFEAYVRDLIAAGRLVEVLADWQPRFPGPFLYYPSRRQVPPALEAFVAFVRDWRKAGQRR